MSVHRRSFLHSLFAVFLPVISGAEPEIVQPAPTERVVLTLPNGYSAHLENPQVMQDGAGVYFCATRPNSGVGGLVWKQTPDGRTEIVLPIDPASMYGLGELVVFPDGYVRYVTIAQDEYTRLVVIPVPGWTPL